MRFLIDAQLPPALCGWFEERGFSAAHVNECLGGQTPDRDVAAYAITNQCVLVTKDDDFILRFPPVEYRLLWLRCGNITNRALRLWLDDRWARVMEKLDASERLVELR
jgi:predicted nuclease of predicted toxin-antitoxin system